MKRSAPPRRTAIKRSAKPIASDPEKWKATRRRSKRPRPLSAKRAAGRDDRDAVRAAVFARDGYRCRLEAINGAGRCGGGLTFQHIRKAGQGGAYSVENGATLCARHNSEIEASADLARLARSLGLVKLRGD